MHRHIRNATVPGSGTILQKTLVEHFQAIRSIRAQGVVREPDIRTYALGRLTITRIDAPPHAVSCDRGHRSGSSLKLIVQRKGFSTFIQDGDTTIIPENCWLLADVGRPYCITNETDVGQIVVQIPMAEAASRMLGTIGHPLLFDARSTGVSRLTRRFVEAVTEEIDVLHLAASEHVADTLSDLLLTLLSEKLSGVQSTDVAFERVRSYIHAHISEPELNVRGIAQAMTCSERYIYKLFGRLGMTPNRYIWDIRLERCRELLGAAHWLNRSIAEIAFAHGFNSSAHFSRTFRDRYGISPRDHRLGMQSSPLPHPAAVQSGSNGRAEW